MGWFQPAGAGTAIFCYDDADAAGGHAAGSPHTWAECNATFPVDFPILQTAAGATFSATHRQYLPAVTVTIGHPTAGNGNTTTFTDITGADIFSIGTRLQFTSANPVTTTFTLGTRIGSGERATGKLGGSIHQSGNLVFRGNVYLNGTFVDSTANVQFTTSGLQEVAGCLIQAGTSFIFGLGTGYKQYNTTFVGTGITTFCTSAEIQESYGVRWAASAPARFFSSGASNREITRVSLCGAPTVADFTVTGSGTGWSLTEVGWSDAPGIPRFTWTTATGPDDGMAEYLSFDSKVVDPNGNPTSDIPIYITSDVDGAILDDSTDADGNVTFNWPGTGQANVLPVRDHYATAGPTYAVRDRVYTVEVNGYSAAVAPNPNYETVIFKFEWPGRDRLGTGYQVDGGSFKSVMDVIHLPWGSPSQSPVYTECLVP